MGQDSFSGYRIWLSDEKQLELETVKKFIGEMNNYIDGFTTDGLPKGLSRRKDPALGEFKRVDLGDVCTDAVIQSLKGNHKDNFGEELFYFLNPAEMGRKATPYKEKLPVITKILNEFYDEYYGGHHATCYAGNIPDPTSAFIYNDPSETEYFWFEFRGYDTKWEVCYNTQKPNTHFMFKGFYFSGATKKIFNELKEKHEQENLFKNGPVSFTRHIGWNWYLPIIGVSKISGLFKESHDFIIKTTLSKDGISSEEMEETHRNQKWLLPKGYSVRDK